MLNDGMMMRFMVEEILIVVAMLHGIDSKLCLSVLTTLATHKS